MQSTDQPGYSTLRENYARIVDSTLDPEGTTDHLFTKNLINKATASKVRAERLEDRQRRLLLDAVMSQGRPGAFQDFVEIVLKDSEWLGEQLKDAYIKKGGTWVANSPPPTPPPPPPRPPQMHDGARRMDVDSSNTEDESENSPAEISGADEYCLVTSDGGRTSKKAYKMKSKPHGIALIISNTKFDKRESRDSAKVDEDRTSELFGPKYLNYRVVVLRNLTGEQMTEAFRLVTRNTQLSSDAKKKEWENLGYKGEVVSDKDDSIICCLMSHGKLGVVLGTNDGEFQIKSIYEWLDPCNCPALKGKPKMIFIQACQGSLLASPVEVKADDGVPGSGHQVNDIVIQSDGGETYTITRKSDFLLSYAAFPDELSFKFDCFDPEQHKREGGAWYIKALCTILKERYKKDDVHSMVTDVQRTVQEQKYVDKKGKVYKQCPFRNDTFRYSVFFHCK